MQEYLTIQTSNTTELVIKKSRFIASLYPTQNAEELEVHLQTTRTNWPRASHYCYAALWHNPVLTERFSDDGEPFGTAGRPLLSTLRGSGLINVTGIVTRYFGGTLLGTGGLVRAYSDALQLVLQTAEPVTMIPCRKLHLTLTYSLYQSFMSKLEPALVGTTESVFGEQVDLFVHLPLREVDRFYRQITEWGTMKPEELEELYVSVPVDHEN